MKHAILYDVLMVAILSCMSISLQAHVQLDYPEGGETFYSGEIVNIQWTNVIMHDTQNWDLYFSDDAGTTWSPLVLDIPFGELSYLWHVPSVATSLGKIRVVQDNTGMDYVDTSGNFTIVVLPPDGPVFEMQAQDISITCDESNQMNVIQEWLDNHGGATATGSCGDLTWTNNFTSLSDSCGATGTALVAFSVSDNCGISMTTARITVVDFTPPVLDAVPSDLNVECDGNGNTVPLNNWLASNGGAVASDACSNVFWEKTLSGFAFNCGASGNAEVVFTASDACGNTSTASASFTIVDTTPPSIVTLAADTTIDCTGSDPAPLIQSWLDAHGGAVAADACGNVSWTHDLAAIPDQCDTLYSKTVHFTATDECGNMNSTEATMTLMGSTGVSTPEGVDLRLRVYPNPADDRITLEFDKAQSLVVTLTLCDNMGRQLWYHQGNEVRLSHAVNDLTPGVYFLKVRTDNSTFTRSIMIR